jgi:hypothetical protein
MANNNNSPVFSVYSQVQTELLQQTARVRRWLDKFQLRNDWYDEWSDKPRKVSDWCHNHLVDDFGPELPVLTWGNWKIYKYSSEWYIA